MQEYFLSSTFNRKIIMLTKLTTGGKKQSQQKCPLSFSPEESQTHPPLFEHHRQILSQDIS